MQYNLGPFIRRRIKDDAIEFLITEADLDPDHRLEPGVLKAIHMYPNLVTME